MEMIVEGGLLRDLQIMTAYADLPRWFHSLFSVQSPLNNTIAPSNKRCRGQLEVDRMKDRA